VPFGIVILPSPLLGPASYWPLAGALGALGHAASVAACPEPIRPARLVDQWSEAARAAAVLVAHSNAGHLAASVSANVGGRPVLYMDAALPPASGSGRLAPPELREVLAGLAEPDGRLPAWTRWWPAEEMAELLPTPWFQRVDSTAPRLDLTYFETEVAPPVGWSREPAGYLAFGTTYAEEVAFARGVGWPVVELAGHHLWHLSRPDEVASALEGLLDRVVQTGCTDGSRRPEHR
jgi:hypothetical protein